MIETGTSYGKIILGTSSTIDVVWTHANVPPGTFNLERTGAGINTKILLNMKSNDCYQRGVPGVGDSIKDVANWLQAKIEQLGGNYVRSIGISAGATAAILFGHEIRADTIIAIAPEVQLGLPGYRSYDWNPVKIFHVRDLTTLIGSLGETLHVVFPAWDISDFRHIHAVLRNSDANISFVPDMHNGAREVDWRRIAASSGAVDLGQMTRHGLYDWKFGLEDVWQGVAGFEAMGRADKFSDRMFSTLLEIDPDNPGLCYQSAMQKALLGDEEAAERLWNKAARQLAATPLPIEKRYLEYQKLVSPPGFCRLTNFVNLMLVKNPLPQKSQPVGWMTAW